MCLLFSLLERVHWRMSHWASLVVSNLNTVLTQNTFPPALLIPLPQLRQGVSVTVPCFLHWQVRALLDPAPFPLAGQGTKDGGARREGAVAAVPSPSVDGCLCTPVGIGRARCPGALGAFSQHSQQEGQSFYPSPVPHPCAGSCHRREGLCPPCFRTSLDRCVWVVWSC